MAVLSAGGAATGRERGTSRWYWHSHLNGNDSYPIENDSHLRYPADVNRKVAVMAVAALTAAGLGACTRARHDTASGGTSTSAVVGTPSLRIAVTFAPLADIARGLTAGVTAVPVSIDELVPPGNDAHEYDPTPKQLTHLEDATVVLYFGGDFQPALERAIAALPPSVHRVDLRKGLDQLPDDPHVWLAPTAMVSMATTAATALAQALDHRPAAVAQVQTALASYVADMEALDTDFRTGLAHCTSTELLSSHRSFAYLARAYGLTQRAIAGVSPGEEPSAQQLQALIDLVVRDRIGTIFFDRTMPDDLARTVAEASHAQLLVLDPVETFTEAQLRSNDNYTSVMRRNLAALREGLHCA